MTCPNRRHLARSGCRFPIAATGRADGRSACHHAEAVPTPVRAGPRGPRFGHPPKVEVEGERQGGPRVGRGAPAIVDETASTLKR